MKFKKSSAVNFTDLDFFKGIFEEHSGRAYKIAYGFVRNSEDASDIVQDTFMKIYRNIDAFRGLEREQIISMVVIYTRNTSLDLLRKKSRQNGAVSPNRTDGEEGNNEEYELPDNNGNPEETVISKDISERLGKYVNMLPDPQREVIMLKFYHGMKEKEIAKILNISESTVSSRISRATAKLREMIGGSTDEEYFRNR